MESKLPLFLGADGAQGGSYELPTGLKKNEYKVKSIPRIPQSDGLCKRCVSIDWDRILRMESSIDPKSRMALIGPINPDLHNSPCPACRLLLCVSNLSHAKEGRTQRSQAFHHVCEGLSLGDKPSRTDENFALLSYYSHQYGEGLRDYFGGRINRLFQVIPLHTADHAPGKAYFNPPHHMDTFALSASSSQRISGSGEVDVSEDTVPHRVGGRLIGENMDFNLCASWIDWCRVHHAETCGTSQRELTPCLCLIDCNDHKLVSASRELEYIALSYVWGDGHKSGPATEVNTSGILPDNIPRVVADAIEVAQKLDIRYLWVDKYCIDQDNEVERARQIRSMDTVYKNAFLTIIAAAGKDSNHGLPGVGKTPRKAQPQAKLGGEVYTAARLPCNWEFIDSVWLTRGWTFQEGLFSRRRLIFDDSFVFFECQSMSCSEALDVPVENFEFQRTRSDGGAGVETSYHRFFPTGGVGNHENDLWDRIEQYSTRKLTNGSDALNAMLGIFNHFGKLPNPIFELGGLPLLPKKKKDMAPGFQSRAYELSNLLTWYHPNQAERRREFPSWSWLGWDGKIRRPLALNYRPPVEPDVTISLELSSGEILEWDSFCDEFLSSGKPLDTGISSLLIKASTWKVEIGSGIEREFSLPVRRSVYIGKRDQSKKCDFRAILDDQGLYRDMEEGVCSAEVIFLFRGKGPFDMETVGEEAIGILVKEQGGGVYQRIGICYREPKSGLVITPLRIVVTPSIGNCLKMLVKKCLTIFANRVLGKDNNSKDPGGSNTPKETGEANTPKEPGKAQTLEEMRELKVVRLQ
jgi:Heterokaryon incompatibility protein (HET)